MREVETFRGMVSKVKLIPLNQKGLPRWEITLVEGERRLKCVTAPASPLSYKIINYLNRRVTVRAGIHYGRMTLTSIRKERTYSSSTS